MSIPSRSSNDSQEQAVAGSVEELRARFERAGRQGQHPRIEDFLTGCPVADRGRLFRILLLLELARQREAGEEPALNEFLRRFPEQAQVIAAVFAEAGVMAAVPLSEMVETDDDGPATRVIAAPPAVAAPLPEQFGRYRIVRLLKQGGMGMVYLAHDSGVGRDVALKVPRVGAADRAAIQRFLDSARAAAAVHHPALVPILEAGEFAGTPYLTMPYLQGETLAERLRKAPLDVQEAVRLVFRLAAGMQAAHEKGVLHRDLTPANVLLMPDGAPVLLDFGLARQQGSARQTMDGQVLGTPGYIAPELLTGQVGQDTPASDIFSLGALLYECLTRKVPFGRTLREVMHRLLADDLVRPSHHQPAVPTALDAVCTKALARQPAARYASMAELAADLARAFQTSVGGESGAEKVSQSGEAHPPLAEKVHPGNRRKRPWLVLAAIGVALVGLAIPLTWSLQPSAMRVEERPEAEAEKLFRCAQEFHYGQSVKLNYAEAVRFYQSADERGHLLAGGFLGVCHALGNGVKKDEKKGQTLCLKAAPHVQDAAAKGNAEAQLLLGEMHQHGLGVAKDDKAAAGWYGRAAETGHAVAQEKLALLYLVGRGIDKDEKEASHWLLKAAEQGSATAQFTLAQRYAAGRGVEKDDREALRWYRQAAEQGNSEAQTAVGFMYWIGQGVAKEYREAVKWYRLAAAAGNSVAEYNLGVVYGNGQGVEKNDQEAVKWFRRAADKGNPMAQNNLGIAYQHGRGVPKDPKEALKWFRLAADKGIPQAQDNLGSMYASGMGVVKDEKEAVNWYRKAADKGHAAAQYNLGAMYENGRGVPRDLQEARNWYQKAADQGEANAYKRLAAKVWNAESIYPAAKGTLPPLDEAWVKQVAARPADNQVAAVAAKLKERNPGFDGKLTHKIDGGVVTELQFLTDNVTDISPLRALTGLRMLKCSGTSGKGELADLSPLKGMPLTILYFHNTKVSDLLPLKNMKLTSLICFGTKVTDLSPLKNMKLTYLDCSTTPVTDLTPLKDMKLTTLWCLGTKVSDLTPLKDMKLTYLNCGSTQVSDLSPLKDMKLTYLHCDHSKVSDLSPLMDMKLTGLHCYNTQVSDLSPLMDMKLLALSCWGTKVTDLSPLKDMKLTYLNCGSTQVSDLSPLKDMKLTGLNCHFTKVSDLSLLRGMPLKTLQCDFKPERDAEILRSLTTLEKINGKPVKEFWK